MTKIKTFNLSDVLSVSTGRLLSDRHMEGVYDLIGHLVNDNGVTTIGIAALSGRCKAFMLETFPKLADADLALLDSMMEGANNAQMNEICAQWIATQEEKLGRTFEVPQIPNIGGQEFEDDLNALFDRIENDKR